MKNNYLIEYSDSVSLQKEIEQIITEEGFSSSVINKYDLEDTDLSAVLEDLDTYGFLSEKKVIIVYNFDKLNAEDNVEKFNHLLKYIDNFNSDNLLFITSLKFDDRKKVVKELKKKMTFMVVSFEATEFIKDQLKGYYLENGVIEMIRDYCQEDIAKILNECLKLKNYKLSDKMIKKEDVMELMIKKQSDSNDLVFCFVRALAQKDRKKSLQLYEQLKQSQVEVYSMLGLLESQFRIMYQVKLLENRRLSNQEIANILGEKSSYRIAKTKELTRFYSEKELLSMMIKLSDIDLKIKSTSCDANLLMQLLILNI